MRVFLNPENISVTKRTVQCKPNHFGRLRGVPTRERLTSVAEKHRAVHAVLTGRFKTILDPRNKILVAFMVG
jgi:hypothetical protein